MSLPNMVLPGWVVSIYAQPLTIPVPLTLAELSTLADVAAIAIPENLLNVEAVPAMGQDDAVASFSVAGSRQSDKIPTQAPPTSMTITAAWNPSDEVINVLIQGDAKSGLVDRTFVSVWNQGGNKFYYSMIARASNFQLDGAPGAESKYTFTLQPRGNQYGITNN